MQIDVFRAMIIVCGVQVAYLTRMCDFLKQRAYVSCVMFL